MNEQVYGFYNDLKNAEQAVAALEDHGVKGVDISVIRRSDGAGIPVVENQAEHSLTPTSAGDVVSGAMKGGAAGLALGVLGGVVALTVPGIGPILAAGPLWAALGATLFTTAAGAVSGGAVGFLVDQGVPEAAAAHYHEALLRGDIIVSVWSDHISDTDATMLLEKYGAVEINAHAPNVSGRIETELPPVVPVVIETTVERATWPLDPEVESDEVLEPVGAGRTA